MSEVSSKELYEVKRTLKELANKKGRGTELVTVYIPPDRQISDVVKHMREELSQSANIKSKQTKKNVQSAIEVIMQRMKLFPKAPEKGLVLFVGMIPKGGPGTEKMETYMFEPPEPFQTYIYHCDSTFFLKPLQEIIEDKDVYLAAKANPQAYKNLIVRVGGYSAYFVDLPRVIQDEIIARTEHST